MTPTPQIGDGATLHGYSDRKAATVIKISKSGKTVWVQEDKAKLLNGAGSGEPDALEFEPGGFVGHTSGTQRWDCKPNPEGAVYRAFLRKNGNWRITSSGMRATFAGRHHHYDFNF